MSFKITEKALGLLNIARLHQPIAAAMGDGQGRFECEAKKPRGNTWVQGCGDGFHGLGKALLRARFKSLPVTPANGVHEMKKVYVHAWYIPGSSAGFNWFHEEGFARTAYAEDVKDSLQDISAKSNLYCCYFFEVSIRDSMSNSEVTEVIDSMIDELCAASSTFWPENAKQLVADFHSEAAE